MDIIMIILIVAIISPLQRKFQDQHWSLSCIILLSLHNNKGVMVMIFIFKDEETENLEMLICVLKIVIKQGYASKHD